MEKFPALLDLLGESSPNTIQESRGYLRKRSNMLNEEFSRILSPGNRSWDTEFNTTGRNAGVGTNFQTPHMPTPLSSSQLGLAHQSSSTPYSTPFPQNNTMRPQQQSYFGSPAYPAHEMSHSWSQPYHHRGNMSAQADLDLDFNPHVPSQALFPKPAEILYPNGHLSPQRQVMGLQLQGDVDFNSRAASRATFPQLTETLRPNRQFTPQINPGISPGSLALPAIQFHQQGDFRFPRDSWQPYEYQGNSVPSFGSQSEYFPYNVSQQHFGMPQGFGDNRGTVSVNQHNYSEVPRQWMDAFPEAGLRNGWNTALSPPVNTTHSPSHTQSSIHTNQMSDSEESDDEAQPPKKKLKPTVKGNRAASMFSEVEDIRIKVKDEDVQGDFSLASGDENSGSTSYQQLSKLFQENKFATEDFDKLLSTHEEFRNYVESRAKLTEPEQSNAQEIVCLAEEFILTVLNKMSPSCLSKFMRRCSVLQSMADHMVDEQLQFNLDNLTVSELENLLEKRKKKEQAAASQFKREMDEIPAKAGSVTSGDGSQSESEIAES